MLYVRIELFIRGFDRLMEVFLLINRKDMVNNLVCYVRIHSKSLSNLCNFLPNLKNVSSKILQNLKNEAKFFNFNQVLDKLSNQNNWSQI